MKVLEFHFNYSGPVFVPKIPEKKESKKIIVTVHTQLSNPQKRKKTQKNAT